MVKRMICGIIAVACIFVVGCAQNPSKLSESAAQEMADKLTYVKDPKTGLCYAALASRQTGDPHQNGLTITWVPCEKSVEDQIASRR